MTQESSLYHCGSSLKVVQACLKIVKAVYCSAVNLVQTVDDLWSSLSPVEVPGKIKKTVYTTVEVL